MWNKEWHFALSSHAMSWNCKLSSIWLIATRIRTILEETELQIWECRTELNCYTADPLHFMKNFNKTVNVNLKCKNNNIRPIFSITYLFWFKCKKHFVSLNWNDLDWKCKKKKKKKKNKTFIKVTTKKNLQFKLSEYLNIEEKALTHREKVYGRLVTIHYLTEPPDSPEIWPALERLS